MLPLDFIDEMQPQLGLELDTFCKALQGDAVVSVRVNDKVVAPSDSPMRERDNSQEERSKKEEGSIVNPLGELGGNVPWSDTGYYLRERPTFTLDPLFHAGAYYVQEASSMFVEQVLYDYLAPDSVVLDLCAAPGGKSTLISQFLGKDGLLVSNEVVRQRVFILSENMQKWGNGNTIVTHNKPADFGTKLANVFDCILVDAPCSGEGMFRKDEKAVQEWSLKNVAMCAERQTNILADVWDALKPGGLLIYSTCTFNQEEDEKNAEWIRDELGAEILPVNVEPDWGIVETTGYHFYPHKVRGEGFYLCTFRKEGGSTKQETRNKTKTKKEAKSKNKEIETVLRSWLQHPDEWEINLQERFINIYPKQYKELVEYIHSKMTCITTGIGITEVRGKTLAPQHHLAMAKDFRKEAFPQVELSYDEALNYLRGEALVLENQPTGYLLMQYRGVPLGFVKNIGNRCNNMYPNEWRIRKL